MVVTTPTEHAGQVSVQPPPPAAGRTASSSETQADKAGAGVSQFLGRVLEQLSVSSWLPSAMLVGNLAVLVQLRSQDNLDIGRATLQLAERPLGILVILLFCLILGAMITQAFQFEAIRLMEGYWQTGRIRSSLAAYRIRRHRKKFRQFEARRNKLTVQALQNATRNAVITNVPSEDIERMRGLLNSEFSDNDRTIEIENADAEIAWSKHSEPDRRASLAAINRRHRDYPAPDRILPTRLGNTLRSREDELENVAGELEGFVIRIYDELPLFLRQQHDQYRSRLEVYCSLCVVFVVLALLGPALLLGDPGRFYIASLGCLAIYVAGTYLSYKAAIASARGYGTVLLLIDEVVAKQRKRAEEEANKLKPRSLRLRHHLNLMNRALRRRN